MTENFEKKHVDSVAKFAEIELKMAMIRKEAVLQHVILFVQKVYEMIKKYFQNEQKYFVTYIN